MNPAQIISQILNNKGITNNPIMNNAIGMYKQNNTQGLQALAMNLAKEKGVDLDGLRNNILKNLK